MCCRMIFCPLVKWQLNLFSDHKFLTSKLSLKRKFQACSINSHNISGVSSLAASKKIQNTYVFYTVIGLQKIFLECIQRPTAAQLLNYSLIKKMRKVTALKDHKLLFNRCKRFKRSLTRRKSKSHTPRRLSTAQGQENSAFDHHSLVSFLVVLLLILT